MMTLERIKNAAKPPGSHMNPGDMERLGVRNICRAAKFYNLLKEGSLLRYRKREYRKHFAELIRENGPLRTEPSVMKDGWALDTSMKLPHLDELLVEAEQYIAERGMRRKGVQGREFIRDILVQADLPRFPSFLNFILSSDVLTTVSNYLGFIPRLSQTIPPGVRFVESSSDGQEEMGVYAHSQLHHLDLHDNPLVYVIVLLRDVTAASGPFTFLPDSTSRRAVKALRYMKRNRDYRVTDETMYGVVGREEEKVMIYPRGTVLFLDSSRCFHFGSRDATITRYQMMYAFVSPCRTDFTEWYMTPRVFPVEETDSKLRKMALLKNFTG
jgi:hypothetical protein